MIGGRGSKLKMSVCHVCSFLAAVILIVRPTIMASDDERRQHRRIAIIGAGYAGLALSNLLLVKQQQQQQHYEHVLFDALHPPSPIRGDLQVPVAKELYAMLGWKWNNCSSEHISDVSIPEETLLQDLRRAPMIMYRHFCYKIETVTTTAETNNTNNKLLSLLIWNRKTGDCFRYPMAFDLVVICNGVRSKLHYGPLDAHSRILVLGDARYTRSWDFGQQRIAQGANQALQDAMQLYQLLCTSSSSGSPISGGGMVDWEKFAIKTKVKRQDTAKLRIIYTLLIAATCYLYLSGSIPVLHFHIPGAP